MPIKLLTEARMGRKNSSAKRDKYGGQRPADTQIHRYTDSQYYTLVHLLNAKHAVIRHTMSNKQKQESSAKLTNQRVSYAFTSSPLSFHALSNYVMNQIFLETRMFWLSDDEEIMTLAFFVFIQYRSVTDRRTDRRTFLLWLYQRFA